MASHNWTFDPPEKMTVEDLADLFRVFRVEIDDRVYHEAPANVKRLFKPSIFSPSPSRMIN